MFVLAHLSDPHLTPLPSPTIAELMSKRALGIANWRLRRAAIHRRDVLDALLTDIRSQAPDHIVVTGDLVNISLPAEFKAALAWLAGVGAAHDVTVVPGNHDAYVRSAVGDAEQYWGAYMDADEPALWRFPFLRRRGPLALIGLSSAVPTPPFMATGALGDDQLVRLRGLLAALNAEDLFRVVLVHHAPQRADPDPHKRLVDSEALRAVLATHGADLVIHGHHHDSSEEWLTGPRSPIASIGAPSASASSDGSHEPAAYHLYRIDRSSGAWRCERISRGFARGGDTVVELSQKSLFG
jgi:3',5'-cyclic AMP phosphodiesterase CpdA